MCHTRIHRTIYNWSNYVRTINTIDTDVSLHEHEREQKQQRQKIWPALWGFKLFLRAER